MKPRFFGVSYLLILDRTSVGGNDAGHNLITDSVEEFEDAFTTATDQIVLEFDTFINLDEDSTESGSIQKIQVSNGGGQGYTKLPTVSITSTSGENAVLSTTTENIGAVKIGDLMGKILWTIARDPEVNEDMSLQDFCQHLINRSEK